MRTSLAAFRSQVENSVMLPPTLAADGTKLSTAAQRPSGGASAQQKARLFESPLIVSAKNRPVRLLSWPISSVRCGAQKQR
jgi:hypothetical protein